MTTEDQYRNLLDDFADGSLDAETTALVRTHIAECDSCRAELDEIQQLLQRASALPREITPERDLWPEIAGALTNRETKATPKTLRFIGWSARIAAMLLIVLLAGAGYWLTHRAHDAGWNVTRLEGLPCIGSENVTEQGTLRTGEWLETDHTSRARLAIGTIGNVEVEPDTRLCMVDGQTTNHRISLAEGTIKAHIWAPPRLFFVETPSALTTDLGCAYTLHVDHDGSSILHVTTGWVALDLHGKESVIPAGSMCASKPGTGPGTPCREDAPAELQSALTSYDFRDGGIKALDTVLATSRKEDYITLWHLLFRGTEEERARTYDTLALRITPPPDVTKEVFLRGDEKAIAAWQNHLNLNIATWGPVVSNPGKSIRTLEPPP